MAGSDAFESAWGVSPTYELFEDGGGSDGVPDMREVFPGSINGVGVQTDGTVPTLTNASEIIVLYHWNGQTDLVTLMWASENFDPEYPDTIYCEVFI